jgi:outer membrane biogenesis lipoprotein LolB
MKKVYILFTVAACLLLAACSKDIEENNLLAPTLNPTNTDDNAGNWKPL